LATPFTGLTLPRISIPQADDYPFTRYNVFIKDVRKAIAMVMLPTYGGSGIVATELGLALAQRGWEVHFITSAVPVRLSPNLHLLEDGSIRLHQIPTSGYPVSTYHPYTLALADRIAEVVEEHRIPLVHSHYAIPHAVAAHLASETLDDNLKLVTTLHGTDITILGVDSGFGRMVTLALERSDAVTAVSNWLREETIKYFQFKGKIEVIHNFVNPRIFHPNQPDAQRIRAGFAPRGEALLIHVSNFRPVKRAPLAIEIFARVAKEVPARLLMVGEGPDHARAVRLACERGVSASVTFLDSVLDVPPYLAAADLFLLTSEMESFGLAVLEAMACGTPPVAFRVGGLPEVVDNGIDGMLVEPTDRDSMVEAIIRLLKDSSLLKEMSQNATTKALQKFPFDETISRYEKLYFETIGSA